MALVNVENVEVLNNPAPFNAPIELLITFECLPPGLKEELEWKLVYIGSASQESCDQELDCILVGPIAVGKNKFTFQAPAPDASKIPASELVDVTAILLTCSYRGREFIRVGYYVNNYLEGADSAAGPMVYHAPYPAPDAIQSKDEDADVVVEDDTVQPPQAPAQPIDINKLRRSILSDRPRVTRFQIPWDSDVDPNAPAAQPIDQDMDGGDEDAEEEEEPADEDEEMD